jgi:hypothetical protein
LSCGRRSIDMEDLQLSSTTPTSDRRQPILVNSPGWSSASAFALFCLPRLEGVLTSYLPWCFRFQDWSACRNATFPWWGTP